MPNGALAPGKVLPKFWVPTKGFTEAVGSAGEALAAGAASRPLLSTPATRVTANLATGSVAEPHLGVDVAQERAPIVVRLQRHPAAGQPGTGAPGQRVPA